MCEMLGYTREELLAMRAGDLAADDDPIGNNAMNSLFDKGTATERFLVARRYRRRDGTSLPVEIGYRLLPDGRQQRNVRDVSERDLLTRDRERLAAVVEQSVDAVVIVDPRGKVEYANAAFEAAVGRPRDEIVGSAIGEVFSFSATSSALLAERLHELRRTEELRTEIAAVIAARAFHPVFQPIVNLRSGSTVGFEALTRFDSGQRPDLCFADAWSAGLGAELEIATLEVAVEAARNLPPGVWLDLNASPRLLDDPGRLQSILGMRGDRW